MKTMIQIRCVGRLQEQWHKDAIHMFSTRYQPFGGFEIIEVEEGGQGSLKPNVEKTIASEAERLLKTVKPEDCVIALDSSGKQFESEAFAQKLEEIGDRKIIYIIGGSWGLGQDVLKRANLTMSLGKMTLPHALARIVLVEQIYRAAMIRGKREYHK